MISRKDLEKLEKKLSDFLAVHQNQKHELSVLREKNNRLNLEFKKQFEESIKLKEENELLKTVNAILGNQEYKKLMKSKINFLIREIDRSIDQIKM